MGCDSVTYRTINLELKKPWYLNYLKYVFGDDSEPIKINRNEEIGQYLFSRVRTAQFPVQIMLDRPYVKLIMPNNELDTAKYKFMYYSAEDVIRISDYIESMAYIDLRSMIATGSIDLEMDKKTVMSIYSQLIYGDDRYETLKKDEYRKRKKMKLWLQKTAKEFGYR